MPRAMRGAILILTIPIVAAGCVAQGGSTAPAYPRVYQYTYEFNTPTLVEDHYIVLDSAGDGIRGWYYGTSDDFDAAREGYLPGFFVAAMEEFRVSGDTISFTLRPQALFASPVPLQYRDPAALPADVLRPWEGPAVAKAKSYAGSATAERITLETDRKPRVFERVERRI